MRRQMVVWLALVAGGIFVGPIRAQTPDVEAPSQTAGLLNYLFGPQRSGDGNIVARGQIPDYEVPGQTNGPLSWLPGPLGHPRYENGGFFVAMEFLYYKQTNPLGSQQVAVRGLTDADGSISAAQGGPAIPGTFIGSGTPALNVSQVHGPQTWTPGFNLVGGWRFESGFVLQIGWVHLQEAQYAATASIIPKGFNLQDNLANSFLFSPVYNFPADFAGPAQKINIGNPGATFGIWNGASTMGLQFLQRFDQYDMTGRIPLWQTATYRNYALVGPRIVHMWERFKWNTIDLDVNGAGQNQWNAEYYNRLSQNMYGVHAGCGGDWWLGATPVGGFSVSADAEAGIYWDFAREMARYELGDRTIAYTHHRNVSALVPGVNAKISLWYYPVEAIQIRVGYDMMAFFNTYASPVPIDFNFGAIQPRYNSGVNRLIDGLSAGIGLVF